MNLSFTDTSGRSPRLILLFAGWGMSARPLSHVTMPGYDVAIVWDYRDMTMPQLERVKEYGEIAVVAWSFGVHAASRFLAEHPELPVTARIAVNGTRYTADDTRGIPRTIFDATLAGLSERSVTKFNMRMCGGAAAYKEFALHVPERPVGELREELTAFDTTEAPALLWDKAFVSTADLIIPPVNQLNAWAEDAVQVITIDGPHLPDFNALLRNCLTDKSHVERRFRKAESTYNANATAQQASAIQLLNLVMPHLTAPVITMLEIGCGTGNLTAPALAALHPRRVTLRDLHIAPQIEAIRSRHPEIEITAESCDAETTITHDADGTYDLIISASTVQWFNSLRRFLIHVSRTLRSGGIAAISTYGPDTMREIHASSGTTGRFPPADSLRRMIPDSLELLCMKEEHDTMLFDTPMDVLRHISRTGVNALSSGTCATAAATRMLHNYPIDNQGKAPLTYHPIYMIFRKL